MPTKSGLTIIGAPSDDLPYRAVRETGPKLSPSGAGLTHTYDTDSKVLDECDWVRLSLVCTAYQIHPATVAQLAELGPVGGANAQRWTVEGPTSHMPGDPGAGNSTISAQIAYSIDSASPGSNWKPYVPGLYRLRSVKARITIVRPSTAYSFRVLQLGLRADRVAAPQRGRKVASGIAEVVPGGMCIVAARDYEIVGTLELEPNGFLEVLV